MVNILIPTKPDDVHAPLVHLALKEKGHRGVLWSTADFPVQQTHFFHLVDQEVYWKASGPNLEIKNDKFDVVWFRRPRRPSLSEKIHQDDIENARKECTRLFDTFWEVIAPEAMWVNSPSKARAANSKLLQLKIAAKVGLKIPETIVSNNPEEIRKFFEHSKEPLVYKTLYPMAWFKENRSHVTFTRELKIQELPSDSVMEMTPGIFQKKIQKAYELRVTYFGNYPVAVKLFSQEHPNGEMDWRYIPTQQLVIEEYKLPDLINQKCQAFMKDLGLIFGCFDFIVTPEEEYYFLEINESGQFLWIEDINPEIRMLDIFTEFLINKSPTFQWTKRPDAISMYDLSEEVNALLKKAEELHVNID